GIRRMHVTGVQTCALLIFGMGYGKEITTPEDARKWVQQIAKQGADGIKFFGARPEIYKAAISEANKLGLGTMTHHAQTMVVYNRSEERRVVKQTRHNWSAE